ncbi:MAG TPA: hypothetical protein VHD35_04730 [Chitinophagaceae bacterium]|nr:hypothetical protein [Chitinophagaceae bacterium]
MAAGGLNATEVNGAISGAEWNPVSIVAMACESVCVPLVNCYCVLMAGPCTEANGLAANVV